MVSGKIYCFTSPSGKRYVGQTLEENVLGKNGRYPAYTCSESQRLFYNAIQKYGLLNDPVWKLMLLVDGLETQEDVDAAERYFIKSLNTMAPNGYNLRDGGKGGKLSEETRQQMSIAQKGHEVSEETRAKMSVTRKERGVAKGKRNPRYGKGYEIAGVLNPFYGRKHTEETIEINRQARRGKVHTAESRRKMSVSRLGAPRFDLQKSHVDVHVKQRVVALFNDGCCLSSIALKLSDEGHLTPTGLAVWDVRVIGRVLRDEGIDWTKNSDSSRSRVSIDACKRIKQLFSDRCSLNEIARRLTSEGYATPLQSLKWDPRTVRRLLEKEGLR